MGIIERLPDNQKLDITQTYESQKKIVNNYIVPIVQKTINKKAFLVSDGIIKHIIHEHHRHQQENNNNKRRGATWNDREQRRKHVNTRRTDVSKQSGSLLSFCYNFFLLFNYLEKRTKETGN